MALIKFGGGITAMSGSIAGNTYARNRYGAYVRARTKPVNPNSDRQSAARLTMATLAQRWSGVLSLDQRTGWNEFATNVPMLNKLGESMNLSGFNHYCRANAALIAGSLDIVDDAPAIFTMPEGDPSVAITVASATSLMSVSFDDSQAWVDENGAAMLVYMGTPQSEGIEFFNGPWRLAGAVDGNTTTAPTSPTTIAVPYQVQAGQKVYTKIRIVRADGRVSEFFRTGSAIVS